MPRTAFERHLWEATHIITGPVDAADYLRKNVKLQRKLKELFNEWVIGGHSMPFGKDSERHYREQRQCKTVSRVDQ